MDTELEQKLASLRASALCGNAAALDLLLAFREVEATTRAFKAFTDPAPVLSLVRARDEVSRELP